MGGLDKVFAEPHWRKDILPAMSTLPGNLADLFTRKYSVIPLGVLHTLVFSFGDRRTPEERDEFLARIKEICLGSGLTQHVATGVHKPATEDQYAPVFVSSAIAQLLCENMETLGQLSAYEPLVTFEQEQQKLKSYGVVWVNSDPLDLLGS